ncbi:MAG: hypothetical protein PVJ67_02925 [Candidatus Pacearchaeota archaeon]|jgi:hypothetical protein
MTEKITLYCGEGEGRDYLLGRFNEKGLDVKVDDLGRDTPIVNQGKRSFYGSREIHMRYFPKN